MLSLVNGTMLQFLTIVPLHRRAAVNDPSKGQRDRSQLAVTKIAHHAVYAMQSLATLQCLVTPFSEVAHAIWQCNAQDSDLYKDLTSHDALTVYTKCGSTDHSQLHYTYALQDVAAKAFGESPSRSMGGKQI